MRCLYLFDNDLRLHDHAGLAAAARLGEIVPVCVLDPARTARIARSPRRAAYHAAALAALARDLGARGATLVVRRGARIPTVVRLAREAQPSAVVWAAAYDARACDEDRALQAELEERGVRVSIVHDAPAVAPDETAAARSEDGGRGYRALAPYVAAWSTLPRAPVGDVARFAAQALASEGLGEAGSDATWSETSASVEPASEAAVLARFDAFVASPILQYPFARNVPASDGTARISAALSFGVVSARTLLARIDARERDPFLLAEERLALRAFARSLARRDFFLQLGWFFEDRPDRALQERMRGFTFAATHPGLAAWRAGRTGYPLVDAGMRQLHALGWMHPRARAIVASFLCFDLDVDWRVGRDAWDELLVEREPALATGNWQWICGVGADLAQFPRIYNPRKQARRIDPRGIYVRRWVPELAHVSDAELFADGAAEPRAQLALDLYERAAYPAPIVDHDAAARAYLARYAAFVRRTGTP